MSANVAINGVILFTVDTFNSQAKAVSYYRNARKAKTELRKGTKDYILRRSWTPEQWADHADRMEGQGKAIVATWWGTTRKAFAWGKSSNPAKMAYKAKQSESRKALRKQTYQDPAAYDAMGETVLYMRQFTLSV